MKACLRSHWISVWLLLSLGFDMLVTSTAKGLGKDKTQRQILVFATGVFKQSVLEAKEQWDAGAAAARTSGAASGTDA